MDMNDFVDDMHLNGFTIVGMIPKPYEYDKVDKILGPLKKKFDDCDSSKICLVFGNESTGLSKEMLRNCDKLAWLPTKGHTKSFTLPVAVGIALEKLLSKQEEDDDKIVEVDDDETFIDNINPFDVSDCLGDYSDLELLETNMNRVKSFMIGFTVISLVAIPLIKELGKRLFN